MSYVDDNSNKIHSPFESVVLGMQTNREVALNVRHILRGLIVSIQGPQPESEKECSEVCGAGLLTGLHFVNEDSNKILREIEDLCIELRELF